jgi:hypothetical protein
VYTVRTADVDYEIETGHEGKLRAGDDVLFRIDGGEVFVKRADGKEDKFTLAGEVKRGTQ